MFFRLLKFSSTYKYPQSTWLFALVLADSDLVEFLSEEIASEKSNQKPITDIPGFETKKEGAELTFTKNLGNEK